MAIRGFFSATRLAGQAAPTALPYVVSLVLLPQLRRRALVTFLIDTGADVTILHPQDSLRLLRPEDIRALPNPAPMGGVGGGANSYPIQATIVLMHDDRRLHSVPLTIFLADPSPANQWLDSLLGRDALDHFIMHFDQRARILTLGA